MIYFIPALWVQNLDQNTFSIIAALLPIESLNVLASPGMITRSTMSQVFEDNLF
jgi:hypothetical protein